MRPKLLILGLCATAVAAVSTWGQSANQTNTTNYQVGETAKLTGMVLEEKTGEEEYLTLSVDTPVAVPLPSGGISTTSTLQIAGLEPEDFSKVYEMRGRFVTIEGRIMLPETVHHHTPVLIIVDNYQSTPRKSLRNQDPQKGLERD